MKIHAILDEVAIINADGTNQTVLTNSDFDMLPSWTRETGQVIFVTERDEKTRAIRIVSTSGTNEDSYIDNENEWWDSEPEQSPMNDNIAFQSTRNGTWNIWIKTYLEITNAEASPGSLSPNDDGLMTRDELPGFAVADVDGNGTVDIFDALRIAEYCADLTDDLNQNRDMLVFIFDKARQVWP